MGAPTTGRTWYSLRRSCGEGSSGGAPSAAAAAAAADPAAAVVEVVEVPTEPTEPAAPAVEAVARRGPEPEPGREPMGAPTTCHRRWL